MCCMCRCGCCCSLHSPPLACYTTTAHIISWLCVVLINELTSKCTFMSLLNGNQRDAPVRFSLSIRYRYIINVFISINGKKNEKEKNNRRFFYFIFVGPVNISLSFGFRCCCLFSDGASHNFTSSNKFLTVAVVMCVSFDGGFFSLLFSHHWQTLCGRVKGH